MSASAGISGSGASYTLDCSDGLVSVQDLPVTQTTTVTVQNCAYYYASGAGISPNGNDPTGGLPMVFTLDPGATGIVEGYNAGQPPANAQARLNLVAAPPAAVPTLSEWAMILFALALAGTAAMFVQRRRAEG